MNPAKDARPPRVAPPDPSPVGLDQIMRLIEVADASYPEIAACITLAADTGARRGELCALEWSRVDLDKAKVRFDSSIGEAGAPTRRDTKNHQHRTVSLSPVAVAELRRHRKAILERALACGVGFVEEAFVFSGAPDCASFWFPTNVSHSLRRLRNKAGLPVSVKLHGLPHTQVTQLLDAGIAVRNVSGRVGHRNASTTNNIHSHWVAETDDKAADLVSDRIWADRPARPKPSSAEAL